jgi:hypothetical protein
MLKKWFVTTLAVASIHYQAFTQVKNLKLDEQTDKNPYVCEPAVAINPDNPKNIVVASVLNNIYVTNNAGLSWEKVKVQSPHGVYGDPALVASTKGTFYFFHLSDPTQGTGGFETEKLDRIVVQESTDGGFTWSEGESIGFNHPKDQDKEWPAIDQKGNLYLTWTQFDKYGDTDSTCHSNILFSQSKNGKKWSEPIQISQMPGNCIDDDNTAEGAVPAVAYDGKIFVAWSNKGKIYLDRSFDGGDMWLTNDILIADQVGGWDMKIPGHDRCNGMPVLVVNNSKTTARGHIYLIWADQEHGENDTDIWFIRSANNGDYWTQPLRVNDDGPGKHQYLPWMTVDQTSGYIYMIFYDRRSYQNNQTDVYLAYSKDSGNTFTNVKISESPFEPTDSSFFGDYTNITAFNGTIVPVWTRMENGKTSVWTSIITQQELDNMKASDKK